jgi:hypothetical protein
MNTYLIDSQDHVCSGGAIAMTSTVIIQPRADPINSRNWLAPSVRRNRQPNAANAARDTITTTATQT